jgi:hypothetical protein
MTEVSVVLTVDDVSLSRFNDIVRAVDALGFHFRMTIPGIGAITGDVPEEKLDALRRIEGVTLSGDVHALS